MSVSVNTSNFISALAVHFTPPRRQADDPKEYTDWLMSTARVLRPYSKSVLDAAAERIIATRRYKDFPLPADIKEVCDELATKEYREKHEKPLLGQRPLESNPYSEGRIHLADDLILCGIGRQAANEGWILSLHDFCRNNMRLPAGTEITKCKEGAKGFDKAFATCARGEGGALNASLLKLGSSMLAKREKLADRVLGGGA